MTNRSGMPTKRQIAARMAQIEADGWDVTPEDIDDCATVCWMCAVDFVSLERAHVIALCDGGSNDVENFYLLCPTCHKLQEALTFTLVRQFPVEEIVKLRDSGTLLHLYIIEGLRRRGRDVSKIVKGFYGVAS